MIAFCYGVINEKLKLKLMKKGILVAGLVMCAMLSFAQMQVLQLPTTPFRFTLTDWQHVNVLHTGDQSQKVRMTGSIKKGQSPTEIAIFESTPIVLQPGLNAFTEANLRLRDLKFPEARLGAALKAGSSLPPGGYVACIQIRSEKGTVLASSCQEVEVGVISAPVLTYPSNGAVIRELQPNFSWMPALVEGSAQPMEYEISLFEVQAKQNPRAAAARNRAIYRQKVQTITQIAYPGTGPSLHIDKGYVWQVRAFYKGYPMGASEYFSFKIGEMALNKAVPDTAMVQLDPHRVKSMVYCNDVVQVTFKHYVPTESTQIALLSSTGIRHVLNAEQFQREGPQGTVFINLSELDFVEEGAYYRLEFIRQNNQVLAANLAYKCR